MPRIVKTIEHNNRRASVPLIEKTATVYLLRKKKKKRRATVPRIVKTVTVYLLRTTTGELET